MKLALPLISFILFSTAAYAQSRTLTADGYDSVFQPAVSKTNVAYPVIYTFKGNTIKKGKVVGSETSVSESESELIERRKITIVEDGRTTVGYQILIGQGNYFCSKDGKSWKTSEYDCRDRMTIFGPRDAESVEYSVSEGKHLGKPVKIYRSYSVYAPFEPNGKKEFVEEISTIDSLGYLITSVRTAGTLAPKTVTNIDTESWQINAKIAPVVPPIK